MSMLCSSELSFPYLSKKLKNGTSLGWLRHHSLQVGEWSKMGATLKVYSSILPSGHSNLKDKFMQLLSYVLGICLKLFQFRSTNKAKELGQVLL